jgi:Uma2 family endonuclease
MSTLTQPVLVTTEELLALPDEGMERWLIRGELREKPMTKRNRWHSRVEARIAQILLNWLDQQPEPRGAIHSGEAGVRIRRNPDTTFGIDVVYISAELASRDPAETTLIDGIPILAVEVLSPSETEEEINDKVGELLRGGVALVWLVDPHFETVQVFRPGAPSEMFNVQHELSADPHLPGFRVRVAQIFGR